MATNGKAILANLDAMVNSIGLKKLAESGVIADPGTSQPAKQEQDKGNIQSASTGSQSTANSAMVREDVLGQSVDESKPGDAENAKAKSDAENITTATTVGNDPKNEKNYGDRKEQGNYPGTSHPADVNKDPEKYSSDLSKSAYAILEEVELIKRSNKVVRTDDITEQNVMAKLAAFVTFGSPLEKSAAVEKEAAANEEVGEFIRGLCKSSALVGTLVADYLDGMVEGLQKQAEGEEMEGEEMEGAEGAEHADGPGDGDADDAGAAGGEGAGMDQATQTLIAEAEQIAQQIGCDPEDVLQAALAQEDGGAGAEGGEGPDAGAAGPEAGPDLGAGAPGMEVQSAMEELAELQKKAAAYDELMADKHVEAQETRLLSLFKKAMDEKVAEARQGQAR